MDSPQVLHQTVHLNLDKQARSCSGWTQLHVLLPAAHTALGLHSLGLDIHSVLVNDAPTTWNLRRPVLQELAPRPAGAAPPPTPPESSSPAAVPLPVAELAEQAYGNYLSHMAQERRPELVIKIPRQQQQQQQQLGGPPADPSLPAGGASTPPPTGVAAADTDMPDAPASAPSPSPLDAASQALPPAAAAASTPPPDSAAAGPPADGRRAVFLRIDFSTASAASSPSAPPPRALSWVDGYVVADPALRRARALFPCLDAPGSHHTFDVTLTVDPGDTAVCAGSLMDQTLVLAPDKSLPLARRFHYRLPFPTSPSSVIFATGPFTVAPQNLPGSALKQGQRNAQMALGEYLNGEGQEEQQAMAAAAAAAAQAQDTPPTTITNFAPPARASALAYTTRPLYLPFEEYERYLGCPFPMEQLQMVFVPMDAQTEETQAGAGITVMSEDLLVEEGEVEASMESRVALAAALARQWFGVLLVPRQPQDVWVAEGLAAHLEDLFVRKMLGSNEVAYRRHKEREAVVVADNGMLPPLCPRTSSPDSSTPQTGATYGTELLEPGKIRRWKAAAVMRMLERKAGEDQFQRLLASVVAKAVASMELQQQRGPAAAAAVATATAAAKLDPSSEPPGQLQQQPSAALLAGGPAGAAGGAGAGPSAGAAGMSGMEPRLLSTHHFLELVGKLGGFKKGIQSFAERWIYGSGCPRLTLERTFIPKTNTLELKIKQMGSTACRWGAARAARKQGGDDSHCSIKVVIHETEGPPNETVVIVGHNNGVVEQEVLLNTRPAGGPGPGRGEGGRGRGRGGRGEGRGRGRGRGRGAADKDKEKEKEEGATEDPAPMPAVPEQLEEGAAAAGGGTPGAPGGTPGAPPAPVVIKEPVLYLRLDPEQEWLCGVQVHQDAAMWVNQLERSKEVVAQSLAVRGLAPHCRSEEGWQGAFAALGACLKNKQVYCRVRMEAAMMLGAGSSDLDSFEGLRLLVSFFNEYARDPVTQQLRQNCFADLAEHLVVQAVPLAAAQAVNMMGETDSGAHDLIRGFLDHCDNSGNPFSDCNLVAAFVEALGYLRVASGRALAGIVRQLERQLLLAEIQPSPRHVVAAACLRALTNLGCGLREQDAGAGKREAVATVLRAYLHPERPPQLRRVAAACLMELEGTARGLPAMLQMAVQLYRMERTEAVRTHVLLDTMGLLGLFEGSKDSLMSVTPAHMEALYRLMRGATNSRCQHYAFMLMQRLAGQAPTLYRDFGEDLEDGGAKAGDKRGKGRAGGRGHGAAAAPKVKPVRLKVGPAGQAAAAMPAPSGGAAVSYGGAGGPSVSQGGGAAVSAGGGAAVSGGGGGGSMASGGVLGDAGAATGEASPTRSLLTQAQSGPAAGGSRGAGGGWEGSWSRPSASAAVPLTSPPSAQRSPPRDPRRGAGPATGAPGATPPPFWPQQQREGTPPLPAAAQPQPDTSFALQGEASWGSALEAAVSAPEPAGKRVRSKPPRPASSVGAAPVYEPSPLAREPTPPPRASPAPSASQQYTAAGAAQDTAATGTAAATAAAPKKFKLKVVRQAAGAAAPEASVDTAAAAPSALAAAPSVAGPSASGAEGGAVAGGAKPAGLKLKFRIGGARAGAAPAASGGAPSEAAGAGGQEATGGAKRAGGDAGAGDGQQKKGKRG